MDRNGFEYRRMAANGREWIGMNKNARIVFSLLRMSESCGRSQTSLLCCRRMKNLTGQNTKYFEKNNSPFAGKTTMSTLTGSYMMMGFFQSSYSV